MQRMRHTLMESSEFSGFLSGGTTLSNSYLWDLSHINLFVGANNSGKSRFVRALFGVKQLRFFPWVRDCDKEQDKSLVELFEQIKGTVRYELNAKEGIDVVASLIHKFAVSTSGRNYAARTLAFIEETLLWLRKQGGMFTNRDQRDIDQSWQNWLSNHLSRYQPDNRYSGLSAQPQILQPWKHLYIPTLRGLRPVAGGDVYESATRRDYPILKPEGCTIFTGQTLYGLVQKLLCGSHSDRTKIRKFENYLGQTFFGGQEVALIPKHDGNGALEIKIGNEAQFPIQHLGDGIQAIIVITFPLFTKSSEPLLVAIEEPELNLHPGMQRTLIEALRKFDDCQFFLVTHSNHFLDLTLETKDISVYTVEKHLPAGDSDERHGVSTITPVSHGDARPLQLLGTRNSSLFLANCTIWVEGITDRRYFSHYLRLYQTHLREEATSSKKSVPTLFQEDLHFAFVEYGGSNITHWSWLDTTPDPIEVERLCGRLLLIADGDNAKAERHRLLATKLTDRFVLLESKEVENLISPTVMKRYLVNLGLPNVDAHLKDWKDYRAKPLGNWIDKISETTGTKIRKHAEKSGTIEDKLRFADEVIGLTTSFIDLSPEAQDICARLYKFIGENQDRTV
jgi:hypothetical protein